MVRTILNIVGVVAIFAATLTLTTTADAKGGAKPGGGGGKPGGTGKPGTGKPSHPGHSGHGHNHHHHHHGHGTGGNWDNGGYGGDVIDSSSAQEETMQDVRYLRVRNETGEALKVFVQLEQGSRTFNWNIAPGASAYLAINGEKIATDRVYIWGQAGTKRWIGAHQTSGLVLVPQPYASEEIGTFTYTFNP